MKKRNILGLLVAATLIFTQAACSPTNQGSNSSGSDTTDVDEIPVKIISIKGTGITNKQLKMNSGETLQLSYVVSPSNATNKDDVTWATSDENIATITSDGLLTAVNEGTCNVSATIGKASASITLEVLKTIPVENISFKSAEYEIKASMTTAVEKEMKNEVVITPLDATYTSLKWSIKPLNNADPTHVSVSADGVVTVIREKAVENSRYELRAESIKQPSVFATTTIVVKYLEAESIKVRFSHEPAPRNSQTYEFPTTYSIYDGLNLAVETLPLGAMDTYEFTSSAPEIIDVQQGYKDSYATFLIKGTTGTATITVTSKRNEKITSTVTINVIEPSDNDKYIVLDENNKDNNLNISKNDLDKVDVDTRTYWNFDPEGEKYKTDREQSLKNWHNMAPLGSSSPDKEMMNSGNGQSIFDGGFCVCFDSWDWPQDNNQTNLYLYNRIVLPSEPLMKVRVRTQATAGTTGKGKFRIRLVDSKTYESYFLLKDGAATLPGIEMPEYRDLTDVGTQDKSTGWITVDSVPDFNLAQDWFYFSIPSSFVGKDMFIFFEVDDLHTSLELGTDGCDRIQLICAYFVDETNPDPNSLRVEG